MTDVERLNTATGADWEDTGEMIISGDTTGGIIDRNPTLNEWFIIFNDNREFNDEWFSSRDEAIDAFLLASS